MILRALEVSVFLSVFLLSQFLRANKLFGPVFFVTMKVDGGGAGGGGGGGWAPWFDAKT